MRVRSAHSILYMYTYSRWFMRARSLRGRRSSPRRVRIRMKAYPDVFFCQPFFSSPLPFFPFAVAASSSSLLLLLLPSPSPLPPLFYIILFLFVSTNFSSLSQRQSRWWMIFHEAFRVVSFSLSLFGSLSLFLTRSFPLPPQFSLSVPFHHNGHGAKPGTRDATGVCFSRERLNVKQEMTAVAE